MGWTSINPSYFDVNYRGTKVLTHTHIAGIFSDVSICFSHNLVIGLNLSWASHPSRPSRPSVGFCARRTCCAAVTLFASNSDRRDRRASIPAEWRESPKKEDLDPEGGYLVQKDREISSKSGNSLDFDLQTLGEITKKNYVDWHDFTKMPRICHKKELHQATMMGTYSTDGTFFKASKTTEFLPIIQFQNSTENKHWNHVSSTVGTCLVSLQFPLTTSFHTQQMKGFSRSHHLACVEFSPNHMVTKLHRG